MVPKIQWMPICLLDPQIPIHPQGECLPSRVPKALLRNQREPSTLTEMLRVELGPWSVQANAIVQLIKAHFCLVCEGVRGEAGAWGSQVKVATMVFCGM